MSEPTKFHSPYQFIPVSGRLHQVDHQGRIANDDHPDPALRPRPVPTTAYADIAAGNTEARHDRWTPGVYSGRLLCCIETRSPLLIGAEQHAHPDGLPARIDNYRSGRARVLAIPGSSLRGLVGATAEALSQSALRVVENARYHQRMDMHDSFKAIGLLRRVDGQWRLLPLALTMLPCGPEGADHVRPFREKWLRVFPEDAPLAQCLAGYFGDYRAEARPDARPCCYQARQAPAWHRASQVPPALSGTGLGDALRGHTPRGALRLRGNIALRYLDDGPTSGAEQDPHRGVLYVLGHRKDMPRKHHEWFVPYAPDWDTRLARAHPQTGGLLPVPEAVVEHFEQIAAERADDNRPDTPPRDRVPYLPLGYEHRHQRPAGGPGLLADGDLIYFDVDTDTAGEPRVSALGYSAIWREPISGDLYQAFRRGAGGSADVLPWHRDRTALTPAERLFGVVEDDRPHRAPADATAAPDPADAERHPARNLASRVRFSDARALGAVARLYGERDDAARPLRRLQSPKPPSAAMYFHAADGSPVRRRAKLRPGQDPLRAYPGLDLRDQTPDGRPGAVPNGRKVYLPQDSAAGRTPWETRLLDAVADLPDNDPKRLQALKDYARLGGRYGNPIAHPDPGAPDQGQRFWFQVDFDNLTQDELDLLLIALDPRLCQDIGVFDKEDFLHRIGWGKPIGLGAIALAVGGLFISDRAARYRPGALRKPRYAMSWRASWIDAEHDRLARRWPAELAAEPTAALAELYGEEQPKPSGSSLIDARAYRAIIRAGCLNAQAPNAAVTYPRADGQPLRGEEDGYEWFVKNDRAPDHAYQHLAPIDTSNDYADELPTQHTNR